MFCASLRFRVLSRVTFAENVLPVDVDKFLQLCDLQNGFSGAAAAAALRVCVSVHDRSIKARLLTLFNLSVFFLFRVSHGTGPAFGQPAGQRAPRSQPAPLREQQTAHSRS